ncbi:class I SAM-dependent methyltransferase [Micromonospora sp. NPDC048063]|uniref:class I SAM-dependent methyltransferase n=1 Tax=Micromonospora sp. NPDC048063 TaxID=3364256 RepID=UPI003723CD15
MTNPATAPPGTAAQPERARAEQPWLMRLRASFDPIIRRELAAVGVQPGQRVLDVGAGDGTITAHLAELVGPGGSVAAVDTDTRLLNPTHIIDVYQRNLAGERLPGDPGSFDVINARCLQQLPRPADVLKQLISLLRPGGWLVLGELTYAPPMVYRANDEADAALVNNVMHDMIATIIGFDGHLNWVNDAPPWLLDGGMDHVCTVQRTETWTGGGPGCALLAGAARDLRDALLQEGFTDAQLDQFADLMTSPNLLLRSLQFGAVHARRADT